MDRFPDIPIYRVSTDSVSITGDGTKKNPLVSNIPLTIASPRLIGSAVDYVEIEEDGTLSLHGDSTVWVDIDFPIIIRNTGVGIPTLSPVSGNIVAPQWSVGDYNQCEGQELIHSWKEGSALYWHIHVITNGVDTTNRYLSWEVEWVWANPGGQLSTTQLLTSGDVLIPASTLNKTHLMFQIGITTIPAAVAGHIWARLKRVASVGQGPSSNPWCSMLQLHVELDTLGSRSINTK